jgi:hypothetical protein
MPVIRQSPSPSPRIFGYSELARNSRQNPGFKELRGQNLDNKGLTALVAVAACTASALNMFCFLMYERKVGCHTVEDLPVDFGVRSPSRFK